MSGLLLPDAYSSPSKPYYAKVGVLQSPVDVVSPDGTKNGVIAQNNNGNMEISSDPSGALYLGSGGVFYPSPNASVNCQLTVENDGDVGFYQGTNGTLFLGGGSGRVALSNLDATPVVQIGTQNGTVYDTVYNPVASINSTILTVTSGIPVLTQPITEVIGSGSLSAGLYILNARVKIDTSSGSYTAGTNINCYIEDLPPSPSTYLPSSAINITSGMLSAPTGLEGTDIDATFSSGVFEVPSGKTHWNFFIEAVGVWAFGTNGFLQLQLVKIG